MVRFFDRLAAIGRVICFDRRGTGVSDPVPLGAHGRVRMARREARRHRRTHRRTGIGGGRAGEVLVSSTVKDLVVGSGLAFADRGAHALEGVSGDWQLFAAS